jgi:ABC-type multidrug transport system fused ATPase/permease subunit
MFRFLDGYKKESVIAPLFKMLEATFDLLVPLVMADIINVGIAAHDFGYILARCGVLLLLAAVGLACSLTAQYFSAKAAVGYSTSLRHALFAHIQSLGFTEMDTLGTSTLITRMTSDVNQVQSGLNLFLRLFLRSPFVVVGAMIMAFTVNARAALIFVVAIPLLSVVVFGIMVLTRPLYRTVQSRLDRVLGLTRENLTGARVVRAFGKEQDEIDRFEDANALLTGMQLHVGHLSALMSPLTYVLINLAIVALLYVGALQVNVGGMAQGDVIALVNYMNQILVELVKLANLIVQVSKALASAGRVQAVLDTRPGMQFPDALRGEVARDKAAEAVRFEHVGLTYAGAGAPSLTDLCFTVLRGQTIGVIGGTGSGKSSLVNLIPRFYDATEGSVEVFGRPVADYPRETLRGEVGVVMQRAQLFGGTIRSNLLWGRKNATDAELWQALETAQAAEFVRAKPLGLDEPVEQGGRNLSGGQKQRLTIARALVGRPRILILDDSASALDFATDAALRKALARLNKNGELTVFIVSQRAASLQHADQILVLDDGRIVGCGTHAALLQSCEVYQEIYESQFKSPTGAQKGNKADDSKGGEQ